MSQQLFEVSGISLDGAISILYGTVAPGTAQDTVDAPQGSIYFDTAGKTWKKLQAGSGTDKWSLDSGGGGVSGINALRNVTGNTVADSLDSTIIDTGVWAVTTSSTTTPANHQTVIITGSHNGIVAKYSLYSRLDFGTKIQGITYDVRLNAGKFELVVFAPILANIDCYRLNAVSNGSTVTLVTGGGGGSGGGVDLTPQLTAEVAARTAADAALQSAISGKADITGLATQFTNINAQIAAETSARVAADATLQASIDASVAGAISPAQLAAAIAALPTDDDSTFATLDGLAAAIATETTARNAAIATAIAAIPPSSGSYTLPTATDTVLGGVKISTTGGIGIDTTTSSIYLNFGNTLYTNNGILDVDFSTIPTASDVQAGVVKVGTGLNLDSNGVLSATGGGSYTLPVATINDIGAVSIGAGLLVDANGVLSVDGGTYTLSIASDTILGGIKVGMGLAIDSDGILSTSGSSYLLSLDTQVFSFTGIVAPTVGVARWYPYNDGNLSKFYASIEYAPLSNVVLRLNKNGVSVGQVTIAANAFVSNTLNLTTTITTADYLTVDIVSGDSGAGVFATVVTSSIPTNSNIAIAEPIATNTTLGGIKVGAGLAITTDGVLSATGTGITTTTNVTNNFTDNRDFVATVMGVPIANSVVAMYVAPSSYVLQAEGFATAITPSTNTALFGLTVTSGTNVTTIGTISFVAGSKEGVLALTATAITTGDVIKLISPTSLDETLSDISITIKGTGALTGTLPTASSTVAGLARAGAGIYVNADGTFNVSIASINPSSVSRMFNQTAHNFTVGQFVCRTSSGWVLASAATDTYAESAGMVSNIINADYFVLTFVGYVSGLSGLIDGMTYYLSDTVLGWYTHIEPTVVSTVTKPVFIALSATEALVIQSRGIIN